MKDHEPEFARFYQAYPRHVAPIRAERAFRRAIKAHVTVEVMLKAIEAQKSDRGRRAALGLFVPDWPYPATWLNGGRWADEVETREPEPTPKRPAEEDIQAVDVQAVLERGGIFTLVEMIAITRHRESLRLARQSKTPGLADFSGLRAKGS